MWSSFVANVWFVWSLAESVSHRRLFRSFGFDSFPYAVPLFSEQGKVLTRFRLSDGSGMGRCGRTVQKGAAAAPGQYAPSHFPPSKSHSPFLYERQCKYGFPPVSRARR